MSAVKCLPQVYKPSHTTQTLSFLQCLVEDMSSSLNLTVRSSLIGNIISSSGVRSGVHLLNRYQCRDPMVFGYVLNFMRRQPPKIEFLTPKEKAYLIDDAEVGDHHKDTK
jgi:hypothetical protein